MRIAVISDTHDRLPSPLLDALRAADEIWHLGDVIAPATIQPLRSMERPLYIVRGNRDLHCDWPWVIDFEREGFGIRLIHQPPKVAPPGIDLLFHGHTHLPQRAKVGAAEYFNPGSASSPKRDAPASWAWLTLERGRSVNWEVVTLPDPRTK